MSLACIVTIRLLVQLFKVTKRGISKGNIGINAKAILDICNCIKTVISSDILPVLDLVSDILILTIIYVYGITV